jgi:amidase/aspartyl-tRNA(Asn)/glutamyl-tRNA(Gln) amidotransferase subunit A
VLLEQLDATVSRAYERTLGLLRERGARVDEIDLPALAQLSTLQANGGFAAAESWAWHRRLMAEHGAHYDPRVATRIRRGEAISAADYIDLQQARGRWIAEMNAVLAPFDALLSPTVPIVAPEMQPLIESDERFFATNALLLRNPSIVNQLDGCALSLPCHQPDEVPVGLMVWSHAGRDDTVLDVSLTLEAALAVRRAEA